MTQSDGQRICGVVGLGFLPKIEQSPHHHLNLFLAGPPVANHRLLDFQGRVLDQRDLKLTGDQQDNAPSLTQFQGALGIDGMEDVFHRHHGGRVPLRHITESRMNSVETIREKVGVAFDDARDPPKFDTADVISCNINEPVSGHSTAGINA